MKKIDTLSSIEGRTILKNIFYELKYEKQYSGISTLFNCWRLCTFEKEFAKYTSFNVTILHNLGFFKGTGLWMEEIVNRYYFSTINSFVYFGAAILLILIGLRRFSDVMTDELVIGGVIFEAFMLLMMFIVMLFTPDEEVTGLDKTGEQESETSMLISEVGEIARDFAATSVQIEELNNKYSDMLSYQKRIIEQNYEMIEIFKSSVSPNPEMIEKMKLTNQQIEHLSDNFKVLNQTLESIKKEEIENAVRKELERIISNRV